MGLKTRLDGRSEDNASFVIKDADGNEVASIRLLDTKGVTVEVTTLADSYIEKPSGWSSQRK